MKTVIDLARQAGWTGPEDNLAYITMLERFAKLVLAHNPPQSSMAWQEGYEAGVTAEREVLLDLVDSYAKNNTDLRDAIRARGNK